jgi:hypothetical protein
MDPKPDSSPDLLVIPEKVVVTDNSFISCSNLRND